ncbi:MAG TPA: hypothetical protein VFQ40_03755, partial [Actinomycetota bacterium]|nr:hypothetical protein [Actinomycetota bacterium]
MPEQDRNPFGRRPAPGGAQPRPRSALFVVLLVVGALLLFNTFLTQATVETVAFSRFLDAIDEQRLVKDEPINIATTTITGVVRVGGDQQSWTATIPPAYDPTDLVGQLRDQGYEVDGVQ